ncbi:MAG TPA: sigma-54 dependent transcriptional regulator [Bacteroidota bacterium]|nr:sigma-54 dependent transcriptional regulator [Bacteroidota bacterium]
MFAESPIEILLIEDEEYDARRIRNTLEPVKESIRISGAVSNGSAAIELLRAEHSRFDVIILDFQIAGGIMGEQLIREIKTIDSSLQIIVVTKMTVNISDFEFANKLITAGACWYCTKYPNDIDEYIYQPTDFILSIVNAYQKRQLEKEGRRSRKKLMRNIEDVLRQKEIIGDSEPIRQLRNTVEKCADSLSSVLISGASGTGKELVACNIHYASSRKLENFVPINCGSIPNDLIESELFGYERGSFTGAHTKKLGLFESANRGTLFLDEVAELPLTAQVKLLRVLQEGEIEKIGRVDKIKVDVRIVAATNKNLQEEVRARRFREDLYYRLNVVPIYVPPLCERQDDIPLLLEHYLRDISADMGKTKPVITDDAMAMFRRYSWPGNVRELKNVVQRILFAGDRTVNVENGRAAIGFMEQGSPLQRDGVIEFSEEITPWKDMERIMREKYFIWVRDRSVSDSEAAKKLGLAPPNYHRMCKELGLKK